MVGERACATRAYRCKVLYLLAADVVFSSPAIDVLSFRVYTIRAQTTVGLPGFAVNARRRSRTRWSYSPASLEHSGGWTFNGWLYTRLFLLQSQPAARPVKPKANIVAVAGSGISLGGTTPSSNDTRRPTGS